MVQTNCFAFILTATDKVTGATLYYSKGTQFPETSASIWYAKPYAAIKGVKKTLDFLTKNAFYDYKTGHNLDWKIQKVSMNAPEDVNI